MLGFAPAAKSAFAVGLGDKNENLELRAVMERLVISIPDPPNPINMAIK